ncbi:imidazole glycerol phosphate synthase subunit HisH [Puniceibacterium sp. IMCC21224]|uniref:imidazole glycerol phosphate synthase subunit HisH n=1 Tax=Puniceibacterium sp. IMCC21224 TaxID=1618204 RepID=UPI00064DC03D|nr:imidazole glycerol phosphate synthase subunit HisH [Puniceibacterium sp. IMCC21224]
MLTAIIDYESGNLHSAQKAFQRMAAEVNGGDVVVTSDADVVARADRIVLPGDGAFPACQAALTGTGGLYQAMIEAVDQRARPFMGICVGMQLMARTGHEYRETQGLGWIDAEVARITPTDASLKVPHMGWNDLVIDTAHPVLDGIGTGDHAYFVHSYQMQMSDPDQRIAHVEYGGTVTAIVGRDTRIGLQFHPEKSAETGLRMIANFLKWAP